MRHVNQILGILTLLLFCRIPVLGCRCTEPSLKAAYDRADAVGKIRIEQASAPSADGTVTAQAEVLGSWKTNLPPQIRIVTGEDCAYSLQPGETYILYLSKGDDVWGTYKCRGNRLAKEAAGTVQWLNRRTASGKGQKP
jgi:hypothetical protein